MRLTVSALLLFALILTPGLSIGPSSDRQVEAAAAIPDGLSVESNLAAAPPDAPLDAQSRAPSMTWFLAEGSTANPYQTWILLFNPNPTIQASVSLTFMFPSGAPTSTSISVGPNRRVSVFVNQIMPNVVAFSTRVDASVPILVERAMYFNQDGSDSFGATATSTSWLFAEGSTAFPFDTWFLVQNPGGVPANVTFSFYREGGGLAQVATFTVGPTSRFSLFANQIVPNLAFSTKVNSDQPVVVERSMFERNSGAGHNVMGVNAAAASWNFAEGATVTPFHTWFLLFNPNNFPVSILARLFPETQGPGPLLEFTLPPLSRTSIFANNIFPNRSFGSTWVTNQPQSAGIVIERAMYFFKPNAGAHATAGAPNKSTTWRFAEGATAAPFDEWLLLVNGSQIGAANVTVTFFIGTDGTLIANRTFTVGDRTSIFVNQIVPNVANLSIQVTSDLPIVAERSMYFRQGGTNTIGSPD
jgi:hypothetical protein